MVKNKSRIHDVKKQWLTVFAEWTRMIKDNIRHRLRLDARVKLANRWARKNPRKLLFTYCTFACLIGLFTILDSVEPKKSESDTFGLSCIPAFTSRLRYIYTEQENYEILKRQSAELAAKGIRLAHELDSLYKVEPKTHQDSVRIVYLYDILTNTLNTNNDVEP